MSPGSPHWRSNLALALAALAGLAGAYLAYERVAGGPPAPRSEVDLVRAEISELRRENARLVRQVTRVSDRVDLQGGGLPRPPAAGAQGRPQKEVPARLAARVSRLKDFLSAHPEFVGPEMRLLKDDDWVDPVRDIRPDTEGSKRKALAQVRMQAQARLGAMVAGAARDYLDANNGQAPSSASQLAPYLADPSNADLLQGLGKPDAKAPPGCLFQMSSTLDDWYGSTCYVLDNYFQGHGTGPGIAVEQAIAEYQRRTGSPPSEAAQIAPYLTGVSAPVAGAVFDGLRPSPGAPPVITLYGGMSSYSGSGDDAP